AQALAAVLAGTGLSARQAGANAVTIVGAPASGPAATPDGAIALDTIDVSGGRGPSAADEPFQAPGSSAHISRDQIQR
ncbi:STN domain-containing protein, partial [Streptococcus pneumoniae]